MTTTSGPGMDLKAETIGLAINLELPLIIVDVQRGGPSTGLPTKTEQSDLMLAFYGHHGESPLPIIAAYSPANCFDMTIEAARLALKYRTPVILLTDGYLANGTEPWRIPDVADLPRFPMAFATGPNGSDDEGNPVYLPYLRDPDTLARPLALPGTPELMHRIGGLEKADGSGNVSYSPENHEHMTHLRADKIAGIADDIPHQEIRGDEDAEILVVGWGSTWGAISGAVDRVRAKGRRVAQAHITHLSPFPENLGEVLRRYPKVLVPEMNLGQLSKLLRAEYLVDARSVNKMRGVPFTAGELEQAILAELDR